MSTTITLNKTVTTGELVSEVKEYKLTGAALRDYIEAVDNRLLEPGYACLYADKVFENQSIIFYKAGRWWFINGCTVELDTWDWVRDVDLILGELDNPDEFFEGFTLVVDNEWPDEYKHLIQSIVGELKPASKDKGALVENFMQSRCIDSGESQTLKAINDLVLRRHLIDQQLSDLEAILLTKLKSMSPSKVSVIAESVDCPNVKRRLFDHIKPSIL